MGATQSVQHKNIATDLNIPSNLRDQYLVKNRQLEKEYHEVLTRLEFNHRCKFRQLNQTSSSIPTNEFTRLSIYRLDPDILQQKKELEKVQAQRDYLQKLYLLEQQIATARPGSTYVVNQNTSRQAALLRQATGNQALMHTPQTHPITLSSRATYSDVRLIHQGTVNSSAQGSTHAQMGGPLSQNVSHNTPSNNYSAGIHQASPSGVPAPSIRQDSASNQAPTNAAHSTRAPTPSASVTAADNQAIHTLQAIAQTNTLKRPRLA